MVAQISRRHGLTRNGRAGTGATFNLSPVSLFRDGIAGAPTRGSRGCPRSCGGGGGEQPRGWLFNRLGRTKGCFDSWSRGR